MPLDTRRITGPENTISPHKFVVRQENEEETKRFLLNSANRREDGRKEDELRPFYLKTRVVSQAKGSAYLEVGNTKVICAVYGPREITKRLDFSTKGQIFCEFKYAPFSGRHRRQYQQDNDEKEFSRLLKETLEPAVCLHKFPKAQVDVFVMVLDDGGSAFASAITVAGSALVNAGIPMYDIIIGCSLHCYNEKLLLDPTDVEEREDGESDKGSRSKGRGNVTMGLMPSLQQVACLLQDGALEKHIVIQAIKLLTDSCNNLQPAIQQNLVKSWKKESNGKLPDDDEEEDEK